jgi:hypothetical protein
VAVCESRLKYKNSARNHLFLARALEYQNKWSKAGEQAEAVLKIEPDNFIAHLELAALELKQSADTNILLKAGERLVHVGEIFKELPTSNENWLRWRELTLNQAIYGGLVNTPEQKEAAKACLEAILKYYPNDEQARKYQKH